MPFRIASAFRVLPYGRITVCNCHHSFSSPRRAQLSATAVLAIASMWIGNVMLMILNLPLNGLWIRLLTVPYRFLFPDS